MKIKFMKSKSGAIEMSMGTMVVIVLSMIVLVLGIFFIQKIFSAGTNAIDGIDAKVQTEIDSLFAQEGKKLVIYPKEREIRMKQGTSGGFGFSIENKEMTGGTFTYVVSVKEITSTCQMTEEQAENLIFLGKSGSQTLASGAKLEDAILVKFNIPETAPLCSIRYRIEIEKDGSSYTGSDIDLVIK
jgi:hypothetical protein